MGMQPKLRFKGFTDDWEKRKLLELATFSKGQGYSKKDLVSSGYPIILYGRLYTNYQVSITTVNDTFVANNKNAVISEIGDVIVPGSGETAEDISRASSINIAGIILGGDLNVIHPYQDRLDSTFLALNISNGVQQKELTKRAQGKSIVHIHNSDLQTITLKKPELYEQQKISKLFIYLDNLITVNQRKVDLLKKKKNGYLQKLFPENGQNNPELRFKGYTDAWEKRKLTDVVEKQIKGKAQFEKLKAGDVEYLDTSRLNGGKAVLTDGVKDVDQDNILILWDGSKAGTVYTGFEGALGSTLKAYKTSADSQFVYQFLKRYQDNIYNNYRTPNIPHVQKDFLDVFNIEVPIFEEQEKIGILFQNLDHLITVNQRTTIPISPNQNS
ncbi:MAG TPA: restriction endonuclease subunit S, partial [Weissella thailandensis]|uniref:restriction endonuclease subunit S n=2 Tax=Weissella thailandensis TaxID=89061 RepID=UPI001DCDC896